MMKYVLILILLIGCTFDTTGLPPGLSSLPPADAARAADAAMSWPDAPVPDAPVPDAMVPDARLPDAGSPDAFYCTSHQQCAMMHPGDCCVMPEGYCTPGTIIATACVPNNP